MPIPILPVLPITTQRVQIWLHRAEHGIGFLCDYIDQESPTAGRRHFCLLSAVIDIKATLQIVTVTVQLSAVLHFRQ